MRMEEFVAERAKGNDHLPRPAGRTSWRGRPVWSVDDFVALNWPTLSSDEKLDLAGRIREMKDSLTMSVSPLHSVVFADAQTLVEAVVLFGVEEGEKLAAAAVYSPSVYAVEEAAFREMEDRVMDAIKVVGKPMTAREIARRLRMGMEPLRRVLLDSLHIEALPAVVGPQGGRPTVRYRVTG
jgi:hypothetical protein